MAEIVEGHFLDCPEAAEERDEIAELTERLRKVQRSGSWLRTRPNEELAELEADVERLCDAVARHAEQCHAGQSS